MKLYRFYHNQQNNASRLLSAEIGALILEHPHLITDYKNKQNELIHKIAEIYRLCEQAFKPYQNDQPDGFTLKQVSDLFNDDQLTKKMGFQIQIIQKDPHENLLKTLENGNLLQATVAGKSMVFGKLANHYWRFDPLLTSDSSAFIIYENQAQFREALRKLQQPSFDFLKIKALVPNAQLKSKL